MRVQVLWRRMGGTVLQIKEHCPLRIILVRHTVCSF